MGDRVKSRDENMFGVVSNTYAHNGVLQHVWVKWEGVAEPEKITDLDELIVSEPAAAACRVCGCTEDNCRQCIERTGDACTWMEPDLCSACYPIVNFNWDEATRDGLQAYIAELTEVIDKYAGNIRAVAIRQRAKANKSLKEMPASVDEGFKWQVGMRVRPANDGTRYGTVTGIVSLGRSVMVAWDRPPKDVKKNHPFDIQEWNADALTIVCDDRSSGEIWTVPAAITEPIETSPSNYDNRLKPGDRVKPVGKSKLVGTLYKIKSSCFVIQWDGHSAMEEWPLEKHIQRIPPIELEQTDRATTSPSLTVGTRVRCVDPLHDTASDSCDIGMGTVIATGQPGGDVTVEWDKAGPKRKALVTRSDPDALAVVVEESKGVA